MRVCSVHGCPELYPTNEGSRCTKHRRAADKARGTATDRGYSSRGHQAFRHAVLTRDPICVICHIAFATVADHHPMSRRELIDAGLNPNAPEAGRGLCHRCHSVATANTPGQQGGWNQRE